MSTIAHEITKWIANQWENHCGYASAVLSGIVGDAAHRLRGGYHISIEDQPATNYSVIRPGDKAPPGTWSRKLAAAIDMSMSKADMALCMSRVWVVWNDPTDPRRQYLNAFQGWDGKTASAQRFDFVTQKFSNTTSDHKWHNHKEIMRMYVESWVAAYAIVSMLKGESKQYYIDNADQTGESDDMFCKIGDINDKVKDLQIALVDHGIWIGPPNATDLNSPYQYCDGEYGSWTARALKEFIGDPTNNGENFGPWEHRLFVKKDAARYGGSTEGTLPDVVSVTGTLQLPASIDVSGQLTIQK